MQAAAWLLLLASREEGAEAGVISLQRRQPLSRRVEVVHVLGIHLWEGVLVSSHSPFKGDSSGCG